MQDMTPFDQNTTLAVAEDVAALFGGGNIQTGEAVPALSLRGKVWKIVNGYTYVANGHFMDNKIGLWAEAILPELPQPYQENLGEL